MGISEYSDLRSETSEQLCVQEEVTENIVMPPDMQRDWQEQKKFPDWE